MEGKHTSRAVFERLGLSSKMEGCSHDCGCDESRRGSKGIFKVPALYEFFCRFLLVRSASAGLYESNWPTFLKVPHNTPPTSIGCSARSFSTYAAATRGDTRVYILTLTRLHSSNVTSTINQPRCPRRRPYQVRFQRKPRLNTTPSSRRHSPSAQSRNGDPSHLRRPCHYHS